MISARQSTLEARWRAVEDHIRFESAHDLEPLVRTFGAKPEWHNKPSNDVLRGADAIRAFYGDLFAGFPDFWLDVRTRHTAGDAIVVEGLFGGTANMRGWGFPQRERKRRFRFAPCSLLQPMTESTPRLFTTTVTLCLSSWA